MKKMFARVTIALAVTGMVVPVQSFGAVKPAESKTAVAATDVALTSGGTLSGAIVTSAGQPVAATEVQVLHRGKVIAATKTNSKGHYSVNGLRNGVHTIKAGQVSSTYRFWSEDTAPPSAKKGAVVTSSKQVLRGQTGGGSLVALGVFGGALTAVAVTSFDSDKEAPASP